MKEKVNKILLNEYIINSSDLLEITNSNEFIDMIKDINIDKEIVVKSKLIHKNNISLLESYNSKYISSSLISLYFTLDK